jgi:hypothetical protein
MGFDDVEIFDNRDSNHNEPAYFSWLNKNPKGFVINSERSKNRNTMMLHVASCVHIRYKNSTGPNYIKICSLSIRKLQGSVPHGSSIKWCEECEP